IPVGSQSRGALFASDLPLSSHFGLRVRHKHRKSHEVEYWLPREKSSSRVFQPAPFPADRRGYHSLDRFLMRSFTCLELFIAKSPHMCEPEKKPGAVRHSAAAAGHSCLSWLNSVLCRHSISPYRLSSAA